jgi:VWFA-related protein
MTPMLKATVRTAPASDYCATLTLWFPRLKKATLAGILGGLILTMRNPTNLFIASLKRWKTGSTIFLALLIATAAPLVQAQEVDDTITTNTSLVQLNVGVVDRLGRAVTSLSRNDFAVYEDGVRQTIQHFEPVDSPFSLVLLLDMSGSTINFRQQLKLASTRFLEALGPEDRVEVIQFNSKVKLLSGFSLDRKKSAYAIEIAEGRGDTYFYEALKYALKELDKEGKRRKAIVVLTDGLDSLLRSTDRQIVARAQSDEEALKVINPTSSSELNAVLAAADRQGVTIYPLALPSGDPKRLPIPGPDITGIYAAARTRLQLLAERTGGRLNEINRLENMAQLYREVAADLRTLYTVAYQASGDRVRGKWHEIRIEVPNSNLIARTKTGYYAR